LSYFGECNEPMSDEVAPLARRSGPKTNDFGECNEPMSDEVAPLARRG